MVKNQDVLNDLMAILENASKEPTTAEELNDYAGDEEEFTEPGDPDYNVNEHITSLVNDVIINTLSAETEDNKISLDSAKTLAILAQLRV